MDDLIEGRNVVMEALKAGMPLKRVLLAENTTGSVVAEIERLAKDRGVPAVRVSRRVLDERSVRGAHQGVAAELESFEFAKLGEVLAAHRDESQSLIVVLDHVTDPQNLGAIARSAEVAGADALVVPEKRSAALGVGAFKASAGALAHIAVVRTVNVARALGDLKDAGYWVAGASEKAEQSLWDSPLEGRIALVLGAEGSGLSHLVAQNCDFLVRVPLAGRTGSLNVANAAAILMFEWVRREQGRG